MQSFFLVLSLAHGVAFGATSATSATSATQSTPVIHAQPSAVSSPAELQYDLKVSLPVTAGALTAWLLSETAFKRALAPQSCRWCETNGFDTGVRQLFNPALTPSVLGAKGPDLASTAIGLIALPISMLALDAALATRGAHLQKTFFIDALLIAEATAVAMVLNQVVKFAVARARPYSIGASEAQRQASAALNDDALSFFSGHSSFAFAVVSATATVMRLRNMPYAWLAWAVGLPLAASTAVLRLAADKHWASDVLVGTAVGVACGVLLPQVFHPRRVSKSVEVALQPMANGLGVAGTF